MYIVPFLLIVKSYLHFIYHRNFRATAGDAASPDTTMVPELRWSPMEWRCRRNLPAQLPGCRCSSRNSDGRERIGFLPQWSFGISVCCGDTCELNYRLALTFVGNGQWSKMSRTCCQGRWSCTMSTTQWSGGRLAMEPMEGATIPPKIYSKL
jgi:hypothetical protein